MTDTETPAEDSAGVSRSHTQNCSSWRSRTAPWPATFIVSLAFIGIAAWAIERESLEAFAGSVVGYVAGYWFPTYQSHDKEGT